MIDVIGCERRKGLYLTLRLSCTPSYNNLSLVPIFGTCDKGMEGEDE